MPLWLLRYALPAFMFYAAGFGSAWWFQASKIDALKLDVLTWEATAKAAQERAVILANQRAKLAGDRQRLIDELRKKPKVRKIVEDRYIYLDSNNRSVCKPEANSGGEPTANSDANEISARIDLQALVETYESCRLTIDSLDGVEARIEVR